MKEISKNLSLKKKTTKTKTNIMNNNAGDEPFARRLLHPLITFLESLSEDDQKTGGVGVHLHRLRDDFGEHVCEEVVETS